MVSAQLISLGLFALVGVERLMELRLSSRNAKRAFARGGRETGQRHYRVMTVFHAAFLGSCVLETLLRAPMTFSLLAFVGVLIAQALRWWAIATLGERWNTRIIVVPGDAPTTGGPYRYVRHPNYVAVVIELACLPLVAGAWVTALVFSVGNLALLAVRIPAEEQALGRPWAAAFARRRRFLPGVNR